MHLGQDGLRSTLWWGWHHCAGSPKTSGVKEASRNVGRNEGVFCVWGAGTGTGTPTPKEEHGLACLCQIEICRFILW